MSNGTLVQCKGKTAQGNICKKYCHAEDKYCWIHSDQLAAIPNSSCPVTGEMRCKCKYAIKPQTPPTPKDTFRKLFSDHGNFTHLYIVSEIYKLPNLPQVTQRLLQNQEDIGLAMVGTVGKEKSDALIVALKRHILAASETTKAAISGNKRRLKAAIAAQFTSSTEVAGVLSSFNPAKLPYAVVKQHFDEHNQYIIDLIELYLSGQYDEQIEEYDCYINHLLMFADMLSSA